EALRLTDTFPNPFLRAEVLRDQGLAARARGDEDEARRAIAAAVEIFISIGAVGETARTRELLEPSPPPPPPADAG
ncbi:MAG TPA: hypothetical protein VFI96_03630, partial [Longimicrobiaceae bacterium]|nr:hypothetical protein [Longimicrobiaceae bacterium]